MATAEKEEEPVVVMRDIRTVVITGCNHGIGLDGDKVCKDERLAGDFSLPHDGKSKRSEIQRNRRLQQKADE